MSIGFMNKKATLFVKERTSDKEGFTGFTEKTVANMRVYVEGRHGSQKWANLAAFSEASELFRFRRIPGVEVTTGMFIRYNDHVFDITSVENVKGRNMYIEVLASRVEETNG